MWGFRLRIGGFGLRVYGLGCGAHGFGFNLPKQKIWGDIGVV